ncbi:MAG: prepilin-type N-terminal cleavage/methylation domain-containing protein, partial [Patescibacteria group bacterium]|nr:prepilin-type N-terminal cleavage/methylation domain-containing protein [Patescibacteria group bacterium]
MRLSLSYIINTSRKINYRELSTAKNNFDNHRARDSFTLIELLIVIAIIGILASVVVLVLNPAQLLSQSRDSRRTQDLSNLNNAIGMYLSEG